MRDFTEIDPNFKVDTNIDKENITFYDVKEKPFTVYGLIYENGVFRRMPEAVARTVSDNVYELHARTAGGRVRFKTNSKSIAIHIEMISVAKTPTFPLTGSGGLDMYVRHEDGDRYAKTFVPPYDMTKGYESLFEFPTSEIREITINLPLYSQVSDLQIGLDRDADVYEAEPYRLDKPVVFYGSSITQGAAASRPGNCYTSIVCRNLNIDYINLGFAGSAKAEIEMAEYIRDLDMAAFVYDYDHNAKSSDYLQETHERMFKIVREANPTLPIIMMTRPRFDMSEIDKKRRGIIYATYENAKAAGDENVYFLDGPTLMKFARYDCMVDGTHPNDLGFFSMAQAVGETLAKILK